MIEKIKYDKRARKEFLTLNRSVIREWVSETVGYKVYYGLSDEFSLGIVAFNEAIDKFDGKGDFYEYAKSYVKNRVYAAAPQKFCQKNPKKI